MTEHDVVAANVVPNPKPKQEITQVIVKEHKMDMDPGLIALLKQNGFEGNKQDYWSNPIYWLLILGFLRGGGGGGLFGGGDAAGGAASTAAITNSAKLDCLQQGQTEALMRNLSDTINANVTNLSNRVVDNAHTAEINAAQRSNTLAAQLAQCCCDLRAGQANIVNELCKQTGITVAAGVANTQRIVDALNDHASEENRDKLMNCQRALSNSEQTKELAALIRDTCENDHGRGRGS